VGFIECTGAAEAAAKSPGTGLCLSDGQPAGLLLLNMCITPFLLVVHSVRIYLLPCMRSVVVQCCCIVGSVACGKCWRYQDKAFPADASSLGAYEAGSDRAGKKKKVLWRRAHEIVEAIPPRNRCDRSAPQLFEDGIHPQDVAQGQLGDCWLLSAIACLAEKRGAIQRLFVERTYNPRGKYTIRLWDGLRHKFVRISVDDRFPCSPLKKNGTQGGKPLFTNPNGGEIWVCLLEKAFAKLSGSYANIEGGHVLWALEAMTGDSVLSYSVNAKSGEWRSYDMVHKQPKDRSEGEGVRACRFPSTGHKFDGDTMFVVLKKYASKGCILGAGTRGVDKTRTEGRPSDEEETGIVPGHAYSILDVKSCLGHRLLKLRNPWGAFEWKGDWSDESPMWSKHPLVRTIVRPESFAKGSDADDGIFWISWEDFLKYFDGIDVCLTSSGMQDLSLHVYEGAGVFGPFLGCVVGCFTYWLCCCGLFKLWCSRPSSKTFVADGEERKMQRRKSKAEAKKEAKKKKKKKKKKGK
jgi:calpain-15